MKRVLTAVILIPIVAVALFRAPLWLFTLLVLGVALLAAREYFDIAEATGFRPFRGAGYVALLECFSIFYLVAYAAERLISIATAKGESVGLDLRIFAMTTTFWVLAAFIVLLFFGLTFLTTSLRREPLSNALPDAAVSCLLLPYVAFTLGILPILRSGRNGALYLLFLMLLVWCGDIAAYYIGRAIGKHKFAPRISPGKTWEGAIASVAGAVIVALLLFHFINPIANGFRSVHLLQARTIRGVENSGASLTFSIAPWWFVAVFAVCINVAAQLGDLVESALKRGAGLKDSGTLLPGHGGVLDRIDALLFALPVGLVLYCAGMSRYLS